MTALSKHPLILACAFALLVGCDDPSKGKTKAVTAEPSASSVTPAAATPSPGAVRYEIDTQTSKVEWVGSKVTGKHEGGFKQFQGAISLVDNDPEKSSVNVEIGMDSLFTDTEKLSGHLKSGDFFDVAKFPKASFASSSIKKNTGAGPSHTVTGNLTLHGVTKSITFPATVKTSPTGVDVDAEFSINRKDFGIVYAGKPDDLIRDDVVIKLAIKSKK